MNVAIMKDKDGCCYVSFSYDGESLKSFFVESFPIAESLALQWSGCGLLIVGDVVSVVVE